MSRSRYWVERAIEDAKGVGALEDYEARFWRSWHHHIAMSLWLRRDTGCSKLSIGFLINYIK